MVSLKILSSFAAVILLTQSIRSVSATTLVVMGIASTGLASDFQYVLAACVWDNNELVIQKSVTDTRTGWRTLKQGNWEVSAWKDNMCSPGYPFYVQVKAPNVGSWSKDLILDNCLSGDNGFYRCLNRYGRYILYDDGGMSGDDIRRHTAECIDWFRTQCVGEPNAKACIGQYVPNCWAN